ncbi:MAG: M56 family metallopeptidase, partial [Saprospiraceae bacterium]
MDIQTYLLHSSVILAFLSIFYWLLLRKETFFKANRYLLLGNILLALAIPLLPRPAYIIQLKAELIESFQPHEVVVSTDNTFDTDTTTTLPIESVTIQESAAAVAENPAPIPLEKVLKWIYLIGFFIMLFRFLVQTFAVFRQIKKSSITKGAGYYLAVNNKDIAPFSFWKYIVINPNKYDETSFLQILEHERIHIIQRHTIDLVLAELFLIVQWFNPLAWWHRHLVGQNLEFLVDQTLLDNGENKQAYQYHLVQVAVPNSPLSISSNYNASQLKNRIKMMNLQRSSLAASWKYALLLPVAFLLL